MSTAFQHDLFQGDAFQIGAVAVDNTGRILISWAQGSVPSPAGAGADGGDGRPAGPGFVKPDGTTKRSRKRKFLGQVAADPTLVPQFVTEAEMAAIEARREAKRARLAQARQIKAERDAQAANVAAQIEKLKTFALDANTAAVMARHEALTTQLRQLLQSDTERMSKLIADAEDEDEVEMLLLMD